MKKKKFKPRPPRGPRECVICSTVHENVLHTLNPYCGNKCKQAEKNARNRGERIRCKCGYSVPKSETRWGKCLECREEAS